MDTLNITCFVEVHTKYILIHIRYIIVCAQDVKCYSTRMLESAVFEYKHVHTTGHSGYPEEFGFLNSFSDIHRNKQYICTISSIYTPMSQDEFENQNSSGS